MGVVRCGTKNVRKIKLKEWIAQEHVHITCIPMLLTALKACSNSRDIELGRTIHRNAVESGKHTDIYVASTLVDMYAKGGSMMEASMVFDGMTSRNVVSWTALMLGHVEQGEFDAALELLERMEVERCRPNDRTYVAAIMACIGLASREEPVRGVKASSLDRGARIHAQARHAGYESDIFVSNTLIDMYAKCGSVKDSKKVFDSMSRRNVVSSTAMMLGYVDNGDGVAALEIFERMKYDGCKPDARSFVAALRACAVLAASEQGCSIKSSSLDKARSIRARASDSGFVSNVFIDGTVVDVYGKCGSMTEAREVFDQMSRHDVVSWTSLVLGYAENGEAELALELFACMQRQGCVPDGRTYVAALIACANLVAYEMGRRIHNQAYGAGLQGDAYLANCLVDLYGKCSSMSDAERVFQAMGSEKSCVSWCALIAGYSRQGDTERAQELFEKMKNSCVEVNGIAFLSVLTACSHGGDVDTGKHYFSAMVTQHGLTQEIEHFHCMIDMLARANHIAQAVEMANTMPYKATVVTWKTVLGACRKWKNVGFGKLAFEKVVQLDAKEDAAYVLMANIYGAAGMWEEQAKVVDMRTKAKTRRDAHAGQSWWTDAYGFVHRFRVGDTSHPQIESIQSRWKLIMQRIRDEYVCDMTSVVHNIADEEKERALCEHSERLAVACALVNTLPGTTIRIGKSLRFCDDCHSAIGFVSKIEQRTVICRDASRFHVFENGVCSCGDFW